MISSFFGLAVVWHFEGARAETLEMRWPFTILVSTLSITRLISRKVVGLTFGRLPFGAMKSDDADSISSA